MKKNLVINFKLLSNNNITIEEFLFLYKLYININYDDKTINKKKLIDKLLITTVKDYNILLKRGKELIQSQLIDNNEEELPPSFDEIDNFVDVYRKKWKELGPGLMGDPKACKNNLTTWMNKNPQYTFDDILMAVDLYLRSVGNPKYIQRADYFIRKVEKGVEHSRLSIFIEEIGNYRDENWTNQLS